jgi:hypothetical protein
VHMQGCGCRSMCTPPPLPLACTPPLPFVRGVGLVHPRGVGLRGGESMEGGMVEGRTWGVEQTGVHPYPSVFACGPGDVHLVVHREDRGWGRVWFAQGGECRGWCDGGGHPGGGEDRGGVGIPGLHAAERWGGGGGEHRGWGSGRGHAGTPSLCTRERREVVGRGQKGPLRPSLHAEGRGCAGVPGLHAGEGGSRPEWRCQGGGHATGLRGMGACICKGGCAHNGAGCCGEGFTVYCARRDTAKEISGCVPI